MPKSKSFALDYRIVFEGGDADRNMLEAYPAAHTLEGLTWALSLTLHFGVTGELRGRGDLSSSAKIFVLPARRGSFINDLNILIQENPFLVVTVGAYAMNTVTPYINGLIKFTFSKALGLDSSFPPGAKRSLRKLDDEKLDKLVERIEPPLTRAHAVIGKTANFVSFKSKRTELATLDAHTKAYLEAKRSDTFEVIDTNITSFNLLTGNGRLYDPEAETTAAFTLSTTPAKGTKNILIQSMEQYSLGRQGQIRIVVQRVETVEHRLKKFIITSAEEIPRSDWLNGSDPLRSRR
ncbi:hypothetical protein [uncultured Hyphomonas sp.]|uniref:DUF7946 domain-containing protein n=1 Tax=uncultured Hyphomonas sp. TaxID=225298 RepID=UPI002634F6DB|nr:hypothetical protein [uncultured Hyphomonas sp.]